MADHNEGLAIGQALRERPADPMRFEFPPCFRESLAVHLARATFEDFDAVRFAVVQEQKALVAGVFVHAGECLVEDDDVRLSDNGAEEEDYALGGEGQLAEGGRVGPFDRAVLVAPYLVPVLGGRCLVHMRALGTEARLCVIFDLEHFPLEIRVHSQGRVEIGLKPAQRRIDAGVGGGVEFRPGVRAFGVGRFEGSADGELARKEGVNFWRRVANAGVDIEEREAGLTGSRQAGAAEKLDRRSVGLRVV